MAEPRGSVGLKPLPLPRRPWPAPLLLSFALGLYLLAFFLAPAATVLLRALIGQHGIDLEFLVQLLSPVYLRAFANTLWVSALSGILAVLLGFLIAYAALRSGPWRTVILSFSGVAANFAGVPLAFAFIATLGTRGILTELLNGVGIHLYEMGFSLFSLAGLVLVYLYFQTLAFLPSHRFLPLLSSLSPFSLSLYSFSSSCQPVALRKVGAPQGKVLANG
jgi:putative spermidine/putrescine transport system permease protein